MDPVVEKAVKGKRLALFKEMLEFYKYPDPGVLEELTDGRIFGGGSSQNRDATVQIHPSVVDD